MQELKQEADQVIGKNYSLDFTIPTPDQLAKIRMIHRDRTAGEMEVLKKAEKGLREFVQLLERGEISAENLPPGLREAVAKLKKLDKQ